MSDLLVHQLSQQLPEDRRTAFMIQATEGQRNPTTTLLLAIFLGMWGGDRFYLGDALLGALKIVSCGGFGLWWLADIITAQSETKRRNHVHAQRVFEMHRPAQAPASPPAQITPAPMQVPVHPPTSAWGTPGTGQSTVQQFQAFDPKKNR
jgi:TM2 domain-containing membrane protein YozV